MTGVLKSSKHRCDAITGEWGWKPVYDFDSMIEDMLENLSMKLGYG